MKFTTGKCRLSYAHIFKTYSQEGGNPKYSCSLLIPKTDSKTLPRLKAVINSMLADPENQKKWGNEKTPQR